MQNTFYENSTILNTYPRIWVVDRFFIEKLGIPYATLAEVIADRWIGDRAPPFDDLEQDIAQVYNFRHFNATSPLNQRTTAHDLPRQRPLVQPSPASTTSHDVCIALAPPLRRTSRDHVERGRECNTSCRCSCHSLPPHGITQVEPAVADVLRRIPTIALIWRFSTIRDVVLSGFQLELYSPEEKCFAYWYAARVMKAHLASINELLTVVEEGESPQCHLPLFQQHIVLQTQNLTPSSNFNTNSCQLCA